MTTAVKAPAVVGFVENVTVSEVVVADVTVPTAPLSKTTVLFAAIGSKLVPVIVTVVVVAAMFVIVDATVGDTLAMAVAALLKPPVVTMTDSGPPTSGNAARVMLSDVEVAAVIIPTAPWLKEMELFVIVESKPKPVIVKVLVPEARSVVLDVTLGTTVAT